MNPNHPAPARVVFPLFLLLALVGCSTNPVTGESELTLIRNRWKSPWAGNITSPPSRWRADGTPPIPNWSVTFSP